MRRSTLHAVLLAVGLAIAGAEYGAAVPAESDTRPGVIGTLKELVWFWQPELQAMDSQSLGRNLLVKAVSASPALASQQTSGLSAILPGDQSLPGVVEMRRESLIRRALETYSANSLSL
jgi:hypothetical protein